MIEIDKSVGEKLKKARESCGLTQMQVAQYLGIKRELISYFENCTRPLSLAKLTKMADLYGYSIGYFINEEEVSEEPISLSFRTANIKDEDLEIIAQVKRFANNLHFLNTLLEERGIKP